MCDYKLPIITLPKIRGFNWFPEEEEKEKENNMKMAVTNPNFSVIMPVGCQAKCEFCYWEADTDLNIVRFKEAINSLPDIFEQCSITGGEPTMADDLPRYIRAAARRFDKIVLNTNGYKLNDSIIQSVDYVNISVHHYDEYANKKIFGTADVPSNVELKEFCKHGNVTFNCVLSDDFADFQFIKDYIRFAKYCGAKVAFRKYYSNLNILDAVDLEDTLIGEHSCGACRHRYHIINDVDVTFKYSVPETEAVMGSPYEAILHANGKLTYDWEGKKELDFDDSVEDLTAGFDEALDELFSGVKTPEEIVDRITKLNNGTIGPITQTELIDKHSFAALRSLSKEELLAHIKELEKDDTNYGCHGPMHKAQLTMLKKTKEENLARERANKIKFAPNPRKPKQPGCGKAFGQCGQAPFPEKKSTDVPRSCGGGCG